MFLFVTQLWHVMMHVWRVEFDVVQRWCKFYEDFSIHQVERCIWEWRVSSIIMIISQILFKLDDFIDLVLMLINMMISLIAFKIDYCRLSEGLNWIMWSGPWRKIFFKTEIMLCGWCSVHWQGLYRKFMQLQSEHLSMWKFNICCWWVSYKKTRLSQKLKNLTLCRKKYYLRLSK